MKIEVYNVYAKISNIDNKIKQQLNLLLSFTKFGFYNKDESFSLFNMNNGITYSGLVPRIIKFVQQNHIDVDLIDCRNKPEDNANFQLNKEITLYDYQQKIINSINNREVIQAATGAGKTFIMAGLIAKFNVKPVIIIAPKKSLAMQIKKDISFALNIKVGIMCGKHKEMADIVVATPNSLKNDIIEQAKAIFWDECHSLPQFTIFNLSMKAKNAYYRIGLSATPWREYGDEILIEAAINYVNGKKITASELILQKNLVPCDIKFVSFKHNIKWQGNYQETYNKAIVNNYYRNKIISEIAMNHYNLNDSILILVNQIHHGELLKDTLLQDVETINKDYLINDNKIVVNNIEFLSGNDGDDRREAVFQAIKDGFCKILIGTTIADEGLNLPILNILILAGAGKSSTKAFQRIGRVLRNYKNKHTAKVYDFYDSLNPFKNQAIKRYNLYRYEPLWVIN